MFGTAKRECLILQGDNIAMFILLQQSERSSPELNIIAREVALPFRCSRLQASVHGTRAMCGSLDADKFSRKLEPGELWQLPAGPETAAEVVPPQRPRVWYRALSLPAGASPKARGAVGEARSLQ